MRLHSGAQGVSVMAQKATGVARLPAAALMLLVLQGCALFSPRLPDAEKPDETGKSISRGAAEIVYRDLTTSWRDRVYWARRVVGAPGSDSDSDGDRARVVNPYLAGRYAPASQPLLPSYRSYLSKPYSGPASPAPVAAGASSSPRSAPPPRAVDDLSDEAPLPRGLSFRVWFAPGRDTLGPQGSARIERLAANPAWQRGIWLQGTAQSSDANRQQIAIGRALAVRKALRAQGFADSVRIKYHRPEIDGRYVEVTLQ